MKDTWSTPTMVRSFCFLLSNLHTWKQDGKRIGRKALYSHARESGYSISEHEVRYVLLQMENFGYVKILKGRGGTVITPFGLMH